MLIKILKFAFVLSIIQQISSSREIAGSAEPGLIHTTAVPTNESLTFEFVFDVQKFLIRFLIEHLSTSHYSAWSDLSGPCLESWLHLRTNLVRSYHDSFRNKSTYWSLRG